MPRALRVETPPGSGRYRAARYQGRAATTDCSACCGDPLGACCFGNGSCTPDLTEAQCVAQGGQWMGAGTACTPNPCPPGPCQPQGPHLVACGFFSSASLVAGTRNIAAWDGIDWKPLAGGFDRAVTCAAIVNGELWVAGNFRLTFDSPADTVGRPCLGVARWVCDRWQQVGQGILDTTGFETVLSIGRRLILGSNPAAFDTVIGGDFSRDGNNVPLKALALWTGSAWIQTGPFNQTTGGYVRSVASYDLRDDPVIVNPVNSGAIGGSFANLPSGGLANNIAKMNASVEHYVAASGARGITGEAYNIHHWGELGHNELVICGTHSSALGVSDEHTQRITAIQEESTGISVVLNWTQGVNNTALVAFRSRSSGRWYVGGNFTQKIAYSPFPGFPAGTLRRIGRSADSFPRGWQEVNGGILNGDVRAITEWNGEIYIGGYFAPLPTGPRGIARDGGLGFWQSLDGGIFGQVQALIGYEFMLPAPRPGVGCGDCGDDQMIGGGGLLRA